MLIVKLNTRRVEVKEMLYMVNEMVCTVLFLSVDIYT